MQRRPLACCALALAAGILTAPEGVSSHAWTALAATLLSGALALTALSRLHDTIRLGGLLVLLGFACIGGLARDVSSRSEPSDVGVIVFRHPLLMGEGVELSGVIARAPRPCADRLVEAPCLDLTIDVTGITALRIDLPVTGRVRLRVSGLAIPPGMSVPLRRGDRIEAFARLFLPHVYGNPGSFDTIRHLRIRGIAALGSVKSPRLVRGTAREDPGLPVDLLRAVDGLGERLSESIDEAMPASPEGRRGAAVGRALLLGDTSHMDPEDAELLRRAGVSHLLAVSGFHVAVLAGGLLLLARLALLPRRSRFVAIVAALLLYFLVNHAHSSLHRAVMTAGLAFAGRALWRPPDSFNVIGLALLVLLGGTPGLIGDAGFLLTFTATVALLVAFDGAGSHGTEPPSGPAAWARRILIAAVAVMVATLPIAIVHFNRVTPAAILGNLVVAPLIAAVLILTIGIEVLSVLPGGLHLVLTPAIVALVECAFATAAAFASVPVLSYRRITPGPSLLAAYQVSLAILFLSRPPRALRIAATIVLAGTLLILLAPIDSRTAPAGLRVTVLDVGQGDSTLVETPGGDRLLVDAGGRSPNGFDVGERVVSRALWSMGIASIGILVVTHPDVDHAGGAAAIVRNFKPRIVMIPAGSRSWLDRGAAGPLRRAIADSGIALTEVSSDLSLCLGGAHLRVLHPPRSFGGTDGNEGSIILRLSARGRTALLPGDAGAGTEARLSSAVIASDILKVGHHGSRTSSSLRFLDSVDPRIAIISCGRGNRFGHPHPEVLSRLRARVRRVFRTDLDGAVEILLTPGATLLGPVRCAGDACVAATRSGRDGE